MCVGRTERRKGACVAVLMAMIMKKGRNDVERGMVGQMVPTAATLTHRYTLHYPPLIPVSYTHLRAHETPEHLVCRLLLEKKKKKKTKKTKEKRRNKSDK
eukprot:TRINITY_DN4429_c0_g1_i7.p2 TRINITY_DN4429_c0_g1~~TRINITY_DN4429_c0_g1_i7.p2  ORF type:complete len:100 (+),score=24.67 TRINITY_DN4429_c0_g1_i7:95-394(+)